ncbi:hypothetical protein [Agaribacterium haliotis]|uniref:hypothetical protein n=1 Tax=Agaribacterium haliotis TaxID=2013869 RepID=UPI000BB58C01|nr:hypothetical protein [Agaribacterium haliotis]
MDLPVEEMSYAQVKALSASVFRPGFVYALAYRDHPLAGGGGNFIYMPGDFSQLVKVDPLEGVYVRLNEDSDAERGVLVRQYHGAICPHWFGARGQDEFNDSAAIYAANDFAAHSARPLRFQNKTYYVGRASFDIQAFSTSWFSEGYCLIKFDGFAEDKNYALRVLGTDSYLSTVRLAKPFIANIGIFGTPTKNEEIEGVGVVLSGNSTETRLSSGSFDYLSVQGFRTALKFNDHCWKITFNNARLGWGIIETPNSIQDFGESMIFRDCFFYDTSGEFSEFRRGEWKFFGCSFDNAPIRASNDVILDVYGGHFENPKSKSEAPMFAEAYNEATIRLDGTWVGLNNRAVKAPPFLCMTKPGLPVGISFHNCKWICYDQYDVVEGGANGGELNHQFLVDGGGRVTARGWNFLNWRDWLAIPMSVSSNVLVNADFASGDLTGWAQAIAHLNGVGTFDVEITKSSGKGGTPCAELIATCQSGQAYGGTIQQSVSVRPGEQIAGGIWLKNNWDASNNAGLLIVSIVYKDAQGVVVNEIRYAPYTKMLSDWTYRRVGGIVPVGAVSAALRVEVHANIGQRHVTAWVDEAHLSVMPL